MHAVRAHAGRLALAAIDAALGRLQRDVAAIGGGPDDGAADLRADAPPGTMRAATAAAEPEDEPPGVRAGSNGLVVGPGCEPPSSAVTVLPKTTAPACRSAHTAALSRFGKLPAIRGAAHLGRHVLRLEQVLDGDRHAVDRRERASAPSSAPCWRRRRRARRSGSARRTPSRPARAPRWSRGSAPDTRAACRSRRESAGRRRGRSAP